MRSTVLGYIARMATVNADVQVVFFFKPARVLITSDLFW